MILLGFAVSQPLVEVAHLLVLAKYVLDGRQVYLSNLGYLFSLIGIDCPNFDFFIFVKGRQDPVLSLQCLDLSVLSIEYLLNC